MQKQPLISVILPNYNHSKYLKERINSILNQTYQNFELIILDDNSTDNSAEIISQYRDNLKIKHIVFNENNSGSTFKQWQKGFSLAQGELIWIAESDDTCKNNLLERLIKPFTQDKRIVLSYALSRKIDQDGNPLDNRKPKGKDLYYIGTDFIKRKMSMINSVANASAALFKKDAVLKIDKNYMTFKGCGDWLFWIELAERGNVVCVNEQLNMFRHHGDNTTSLKERNGTNRLEIKRIYDYLKRNHYLSKKQAFKIKLKYVYSVLYEINFENEEIKTMCLKTWEPNVFITSLAWLKHKKGT